MWPVPKDPEQRLYFGMLEAIGYQCFKNGDAPKGYTEEQIKRFLKRRAKRIKGITNPDWLSTFVGKYDFLAPHPSRLGAKP
jgi:hypothetical protein